RHLVFADAQLFGDDFFQALFSAGGHRLFSSPFLLHRVMSQGGWLPSSAPDAPAASSSGAARPPGSLDPEGGEDSAAGHSPLALASTARPRTPLTSLAEVSLPKSLASSTASLIAVLRGTVALPYKDSKSPMRSTLRSTADICASGHSGARCWIRSSMAGRCSSTPRT